MDRLIHAMEAFGFAACLLLAGVTIHLGWDLEQKVFLTLGIFFAWQWLSVEVSQRRQRSRPPAQ